MPIHFILIVIFSSPITGIDNPTVGTIFKQEFPTQAGCINTLESAFKQPVEVKTQIIHAGCYPLK